MTDLYQQIVDEVTRHGDPTDLCQKIYKQPHTSTTGIRKRLYWEAVREGRTKHWLHKTRQRQTK